MSRCSSAAVTSTTGCHWLQRGSIKAPSSVVSAGYGVRRKADRLRDEAGVTMSLTSSLRVHPRIGQFSTLNG
jgi:hypothetical protein